MHPTLLMDAIQPCAADPDMHAAQVVLIRNLTKKTHGTDDQN